MAERMTRDDHVARAEELAEAAYAYHLDLIKAGKILKENPGALVTPQQSATLGQVAAASNARIQSLATLATAYAKIAEVLGHQAAEGPSASVPWVPHGRDHVRYGEWELSFVAESELSPDQFNPGWYLYGPGVHPCGSWSGFYLGEAQQKADYVVRSHEARQRTRDGES